MISLVELFLQFKRNKINIATEDEVFIPAALMRKHVKNYVPFREACFIMKGYSNHISGKCDLIIGYTESFDALFLELLKLQYRLSLSLPLHYTCPLRKLDNVHHNFEILGTLTPGADVNQYHQTDKSPRYYIWLQNIGKEQKREIYSGCIDFDITACHPMIFWKEVLKERTTNPYMKTMIEQPEIFLQTLIDHKIHSRLYPNKKIDNERDAAKDCRNRLFNLSLDNKHKQSGVQWYDELQDYIIKEMHEMSICEPHKFFCRHERKIIESAIDIIGEENVVLLMHDGLIVKSLTNVTINNLQQQTGYTWKVKVL